MIVFRFGILGLSTILIVVNLPLQAQESTASDVPLPPFPANCEPLPLVGGEGSTVTKEISPPGINIPLPVPVGARIRNNWHTDWYIPDARTYQTYQIMFMPHDDREYDVAMYLKYPDDTDQQFYDEQQIDLMADEPIVVEVTPERSDLFPYQVNTNIGGVQAIGANYTVAAAGCR